ncbi:hypothetical protein PHYSODRAFT_294893 [Phytophthora sojae]|uniref:Uncharacterized protein n=1 Tax=Phytophthora sojae (strain P6497) TaxID=1094619 RepID=G4YJI1_PHYSP|nr:hypothetical protein PHYSODRAFT_294893 [Phytophthora sojae]EGZ29936.1 hypothetical protein PHYSODRAFT_294893 [Phytophthora sojae]|eukprot:XP_009517211.1 hypothetical protein PHYSODRAFT_294893 [Phytophthora sojae]
MRVLIQRVSQTRVREVERWFALVSTQNGPGIDYGKGKTWVSLATIAAELKKSNPKKYPNKKVVVDAFFGGEYRLPSCRPGEPFAWICDGGGVYVIVVYAMVQYNGEPRYYLIVEFGSPEDDLQGKNDQQEIELLRLAPVQILLAGRDQLQQLAGDFRTGSFVNDTGSKAVHSLHQHAEYNKRLKAEIEDLKSQLAHHGIRLEKLNSQRAQDEERFQGVLAEMEQLKAKVAALCTGPHVASQGIDLTNPL